MVAVALGAGCGEEALRKPPVVDPTEALTQAAKKVDFAIAETKRMIQRSRGADYLPDLYMRLAELYTERARYAWLVVYERRRSKGDESKAFDAPEARLLKNLGIGVYDRLLREFPKYARGDEALFLMAHEYRELGEFDNMKSTYEKLIDQYPRSQHRLEAYLVLGDSSFDKNDLAKAEQYYNLVIAAPESHVHPLARYKLAWVRVNRDDCKGAVRLFEKVLRDKATPTEKKTLVKTQRSLNISRESLVDLAYCYPEVYPDKPAPPYLRSLAASSSDYVAALRRVGNRFFLKGMYAQAVQAHREVLAAAVGDEEAVETARKLYDTILKGKVYDRPGADVDRIGRVLEERIADYRVPKDQRDKLATEFEIYARDIATRAHVAAKETKTPAALAAAAAGYNSYLAYFPKSAARLEIEENRAEALQQAEKFYDAGRAYETLEALEKSPEQKKQARQNAIAAYQQALEKGSLNPLQRLAARGGIRAMGRLFIADYPQDPQVISIKLSIARSYYDQGDYERSAELFYALARQYPTSNEATISGHLALDALRLAENLEGLTAMGRRMIADARLGNAQFKSEVQDIVSKAEQRQVTELTVTGSSDREEQLLSMAKRHKGSELGEQALYNTLLVARSSGDIDRFYELGEEFLEQYPKSTRRTDVATSLASVSTDRADYVQASKFLDAAAAAEPDAKNAAERLYAAAEIRAVLGDPNVASDVKKLIARNSNKVDDLLMVMAKSGNMTPVEDVLANSAVVGPVPSFLRGYLEYLRGDRDAAQRDLMLAVHEKGDSEAEREAIARARFLVGELAFDQFQAASGQGDIAKVLQEKSELLTQTDHAYSLAIQARDARWALAALARVSDAYARFAEFMHGLKLPDGLSADEQKQLQAALDAKADEAQKRATEFRNLCAKKAHDVNLFSEAGRSCLTGKPFEEKVAMFPKSSSRRAGDPPGAAPLRAQLMKKPKAGDVLAKLAGLYLGAGDTGMALLMLDRAEDVAPKDSNVQNLKGVALQRSGDPDGAYQAFSKALELDGANLQARQNLAAHYAFYGYTDKAVAEAKRAAGAPPPHGDVAEHPEINVLQSLGGGAGGKR